MEPAIDITANVRVYVVLKSLIQALHGVIDSVVAKDELIEAFI